ncbi:MAG TPA: choice-of-anchor R domain-containing protein [Chloroflexia bacterium]|nr:choice-of-anchor R domain-containing protein [Chloroflexia bacterium]
MHGLMNSIWNSRFSRTFLAVIPLLVIPLVISLGVAPNARDTSAFAASPTVLHDQLNNFEGTIVSFENGTNFSSQAADDFIVPPGKTWTLTQVDVSGFPVVGSDQPAFFNVFLYRDNGTLPGVQVASYSNLSYAFNSTNGEYSIAFPSTLLKAGTYWVSVQADTTAAGNRWTWTGRLTPAVNNGAAWRNPGNGFSSGCTDWGTKTACQSATFSGPDQTFRLHGTEETPVPAPVLHDQLNKFEGSIVSFENGTNFSSQAADDFMVPPGKTWTLTQVDVSGFPVVGAAQPTSFNVFLYSDSSTLPGSQVASYSNLDYAFNTTNGEYSIDVPPTSLGSGTYWVSVQADTTAAGNRWTWTGRLTPAVNNGAAWRNPGNGFGSGCTDWGRKTTCQPATLSGPDQTYRLHGIEATPTATPTSPPAATATPVRGVPPGFEPHYACRATKDGALRDTGVLVAVGPRPTCLKNEVLVAILVNDAP